MKVDTREAETRADAPECGQLVRIRQVLARLSRDPRAIIAVVFELRVVSWMIRLVGYGDAAG